ncbi:MAG TPA: Cof-type HAD-IIB family hydrolase [Leptolinea sp.]
MKTLYVSDLDGTLFNSEKVVSQYSADMINRFIAQGGLFTIATARMAFICDKKLGEININIPGIIMNGACLYSFREKKYMDVQAIEPSRIEEIEKILRDEDHNAYMYAYKKNSLSIFYRSEPTDADSSYIGKYAQESCQEIRQVDSFAQTASDRQIIFFASTGSKEKIMRIWDKLKEITGIESVVYSNIYNGLYCMDVFDQKANKANALTRLKKLLQVDEITAFGDNQNDISMMHIADLCYAPENALDEVKQMANEILESCDNDGVARFLQRKYNL